MRLALVRNLGVGLQLAVFLAPPAYPKAKHVWQTGGIVDYSVPAPFQGRMTNGNFSQSLPAQNQIGSASSYTIQADGYLYYCSEFQIAGMPVADALDSVIRFYRDRGGLVMRDDTGREHKAHIVRRVAI